MKPRKEATPALVADIVAHPEKYGFVWVTGEVFKNGMSLGYVPLRRHTDTALVEETFGTEYLHAALNGGNSPRVTDQGIGRDARWEDRKVTDAALKVQIVERALGKRSARKVTVITEKVFVADDGTEFATLDEVKAYNAELRAEAVEAVKNLGTEQTDTQ